MSHSPGRLPLAPMLAMILLATAALGGCAETEIAAEAVKEVRRSTRPPVEASSDLRRYVIGAPYEIGGRRYTPAEDWTYAVDGVAGIMSDGRPGQPTALGELRDDNALTAAHKTLPMPSLIRVINLANGRTVVLRVNDRGPTDPGQFLAVSPRAAQLLNFGAQTQARVRVEILAEESLALKNRIILAGGRVDESAETRLVEATATATPVSAPPPVSPPPRPTRAAPPPPPPPPAEERRGENRVIVSSLSEPSALSREQAPPAPTMASPGTGADPVARAAIAEAPPPPPAPPPERASEPPPVAIPSTPVAATAPVPEIAALTIPEPSPEPPSASVSGSSAANLDAALASLPPPARTPEPQRAEPAPETRQAAAVAAKPVAGSRAVFIQVGAFSERPRADKVVEGLKSLGEASVAEFASGGRTLHRVRLGPWGSRADAAARLSEVQAAGFPDARIVVE